MWKQRASFLKGGRLAPQTMTVTVLFSDLMNFTPMAERLTPDQLMDWLNNYMDSMAGLVIAHGGVVDDYYGDAIKANFGVPFARASELEIAADARRAVRCALEMSATLARINAAYAARELPTVAMRIGINTGAVVAGSLGSADRLKYTVVGDAVVVAQRLESLDGVAHDFDANPCRVLISGETARRLSDEFRLEPLGARALKGKDEPVGVYRLLSWEAS
jgi:adenylate cyclase